MIASETQVDRIRGAGYWALSGVQYLSADEVQKYVHQEAARYLAATGRNPARVSNTMLRQLMRRDAHDLLFSIMEKHRRHGSNWPLLSHQPS